jgi:hypothetical protein
MEFVKITCEWDIGLEDKAFTTEEIARAHAAKAFVDCELDLSIDEAEEEGLIHFHDYDTDDFISTMPKGKA